MSDHSARARGVVCVGEHAQLLACGAPRNKPAPAAASGTHQGLGQQLVFVHGAGQDACCGPQDVAAQPTQIMSLICERSVGQGSGGYTTVMWWLPTWASHQTSPPPITTRHALQNCVTAVHGYRPTTATAPRIDPNCCSRQAHRTRLPGGQWSMQHISHAFSAVVAMAFCSHTHTRTATVGAPLSCCCSPSPAISPRCSKLL
jgi:hypothetical protein